MATREAKISEEQGSMDVDLSVGDEVEVFLSEIEVEGWTSYTLCISWHRLTLRDGFLLCEGHFAPIRSLVVVRWRFSDLGRFEKFVARATAEDSLPSDLTSSWEDNESSAFLLSRSGFKAV